MATAPHTLTPNTLDPMQLDQFKQALGSANVSDDPETRALFSQDVWAKGETCAVVLSPENTEQLARTVSLAAQYNIALAPRGGGMSYTEGYTPSHSGMASLDLSRMDKIIKINAEDMYVTVEAGCTWNTLYEALKPLGLRTPFWGPLSGISSTIGGGLSQNNAFFGAGTYGPSTESVTSLTLVMADGEILRTGTAGMRDAKPFWRHYGPDLTGLFLGDAGAFAIKAEATLRLIPTPAHEDWASFECDTAQDWATALQQMGRTGLACELFGFDPNLQAVRMTRASLLADAKALGQVIKGNKSGLVKGLKEGAKVALAGRSYMDDVTYSLHMIVEGHSQAEVQAKMDTLKALAREAGAKPIENSIPKIIRANPFTPLNNMVGPRGERWVPVHGIVSMSDGPACLADIEALFAARKDDIERYDITTGYLVTTLSTNGYLVEPVFIWPEELFALHRETVEAHLQKKFTNFAPNPEATKLVAALRQDVIDIFTRFGAAHFQVGRAYPYFTTRETSTQNLLTQLKTGLDPQGLINPGALGLAKPCS